MKQIVRGGRELPESLKEAPELFFHLRPYLEAFYELDTERTEGPIPWSSICKYADRKNYDWEEEEILFYMIRRIDEVVLKHRSDKIKERMKQAENSRSQQKGKRRR